MIKKLAFAVLLLTGTAAIAAPVEAEAAAKACCDAVLACCDAALDCCD